MHLQRRAFVYIRQSTLRQVRENVESTQRQYALVERAVELGWPREQVEVVGEDGTLDTRKVERPREEWEVLIQDHPPPYIEWSEYLENQRRLEANRMYGPDALTPGPAREGRALLQGLVVCGACGRRLRVRYTGNGGRHAHYECHQGRREGRTGCRSLRAEVADGAVEARVLEALTPAHLELAVAAVGELEGRREAERRRWRQSSSASAGAAGLPRRYSFGALLRGSSVCGRRPRSWKRSGRSPRRSRTNRSQSGSTPRGW